MKQTSEAEREIFRDPAGWFRLQLQLIYKDLNLKNLCLGRSIFALLCLWTVV